MIGDDERYQLRGVPMYGQNGDGPRAEDDSEIQKQLILKRASREADRLLRNESWVEPDDGWSLAEARRDPPSPVRQVIHKLLPEGITILAAQFKSGKTTLGIDMASCLLAGEDFLESFEVDELAGNVGYWNMEVDESQMYEWQDRRVGAGAERFFTAHLRGKRMDLLSDVTAEWAVKWLTNRDVDVWFLDPMGRMLDDENNASEFNRWFQALEQIVTEAKVRATLIIHHSGHADAGMHDAIPRARGSSAMLGNTDANINYRHGGDLGQAPPDSRRYLSAFGRGVDVPEMTLEFDRNSGQLYEIASASGREGDRLERGIDRAVAAVEDAGNWVLNKTRLKNAMGGSNTGKDAVIEEAIRSGRLIARSDAKTSTGMLFGVPDDENNSKSGRIRASS